MNCGVANTKTEGSGSGGRGLRRRSTRVHLRKSRKPWSCDAGHGFRNPPPGRWCAGEVGDVDEAVTGTASDTDWSSDWRQLTPGETEANGERDGVARFSSRWDTDFMPTSAAETGSDCVNAIARLASVVNPGKAVCT